MPRLGAIGTEAARGFARVDALLSGRTGLADKDKLEVRMMVASALLHGILVARPEAGGENAGLGLSEEDAAWNGVASIAAAERREAHSFADQEGMAKPPSRSRDSTLPMMRALEASRRVGPGVSRRMLVGRGEEHVIDELSGMIPGQSQGPSCDTVASSPSHHYYYFPMGDSLDATPGCVPFSTQRINSRVVWLDPLLQAVSTVRGALRSEAEGHAGEGAGDVILQCVPLDRPTGFGRHPLVLSRSGPVVSVPVSNVVALQTNANAGTGEAPEPVSTLVEEAALLRRGYGPPASTRTRIARMRSVVFNAERLLAGLALTAATSTSSSCLRRRLVVRLHQQEDAVALALALAMHQVDAEPGAGEIVVHVDGHAEVASALGTVTLPQLRYVIGRKCHACLLSELCLCL